ncbi:MAG: polysaccharide deacetylase family protein [Quadrisphaera sp.]
MNQPDQQPSWPSRRQTLAALAALSAGGAAALAGCTSTDGTGGTDQSGTTTAGASGAPSGSAGASSASAGASSPSSSPSSLAGGVPTGADITAGPASSGGVALTFHGAGDPKVTQDVVKELASAGAFITVLAVGTWLSEDPQMARLLLDGGHELGNHTWSHRDMTSLSPADTAAEVQRAAAELKTLTGSTGRWFRPSATTASTPVIRAAAMAAGYGACLMYDVDPMDNRDPGASAIASRLLGAVQPGSIVSLHLGHAGTRDALPAMLDGLRQKGLRAVTASQLLGVR